ncbi:hypothetical protein OV208_30055 [Corallococcus sp. bb12-1]|uniref:hypothetical protein n=1 Tax=Corallococcus sp. bb12-1 TaxID=2996784 RepID=UPI00226E0AC0|nr:hypothetical protein [Corallococcus sp. bb12-1]MCY1045597.1 hypothetical protein [Corallococcus sp. bb12-1]
MEAKEVLEQAQFVVTKIPESSRRVPDFSVRKNGEAFFLEVTEKEPMEVFNQMLLRAKAEGFATLAREVEASNRLDGLVRGKAAQLDVPERPGDFRVLWIAAPHSDFNHVAEIVFRTLYGAVRVSVFPSLDVEEVAKVGMGVHYCYYYDRFTFYRVRRLDGVVLYGRGGGYLFVNPLSERVVDFRRSEICLMFAGVEGMRVVDPEVKHGENDMFMGFDVDRSDGHARWNYIREMYGVHAERVVEANVLDVAADEVPD